MESTVYLIYGWRLNDFTEDKELLKNMLMILDGFSKYNLICMYDVYMEHDGSLFLGMDMGSIKEEMGGYLIVPETVRGVLTDTIIKVLKVIERSNKQVYDMIMFEMTPNEPKLYVVKNESY